MVMIVIMLKNINSLKLFVKLLPKAIQFSVILFKKHLYILLDPETRKSRFEAVC